MKLDNYALHLPQYSIGTEVYDQMEGLCTPYGKTAVIIGGKQAMAAARDKIFSAANQAGIRILDEVLYGHDCTYAVVDALKDVEAFRSADMVFGVGGGKALDTCKCLCEQTGKPLFAFPTIASNCAACTTVSIMYNADGTFLEPYFFLKPPIHTFIDTDIIARAPGRYLWAGIGDTYAKYYEATISSRGESLPHFTALGVTVSRMCLDPLLEYGTKGYADNLMQTPTHELEQTVLAIVVTTAIASIFLTRDFTPDYNSGLAHAVFYALTRFPVIEEAHLHGEVVGFGVLLALLVDGQTEEYERIRGLNQSIGLPCFLKDIDLTREMFEDTLEIITAMPDLRHYPYTVTREMLLDALDILENHE